MKHLTIGKKLILSFASLLVLMVLLSGLAVYRLTHITDTFVELVTENTKIADEAMEIKIDLLIARQHENTFIRSREKQALAQMSKIIASLKQHNKTLSNMAAGLGLDEVAANSQQIVKATDEYEKGFSTVAGLIQAQGDKTSGIMGEIAKRARGLEGIIKPLGSSAFMNEFLTMRGHEKDLVSGEGQTVVAKVKSIAESMVERTYTSGMDSESMDRFNADLKAYLAAFIKLADNFKAMRTQVPVMRTAAGNIDKLAIKIENEVKAVTARKQIAAIDQKNATITFLYGLCGFIVLVGVGMSYYSVRGVTKPLHRIIKGFSESSDQVAAASSEISSSSQMLASGSAEQAASIEQTSASLEQMSAMTNQNASNAKQADTLMQETNNVVQQANDAMLELTASMDEISNASEETSKIIKTIDEIAFQTNLLALNAAVEAARAGEAGAGFAVVADEVRNLAMRAADAAKSTASLIEDTVKKTQGGTQLGNRTNEAFSAVAENAAKVGDLVAEIAAASSEQAQGIGQVNKAVVEMEKVVQQNAATSEESAAASEQMSAQAEQMRYMVDELLDFVGGRQAKTARVESGQKKSPQRAPAGGAADSAQDHSADSRKLVAGQGAEAVYNDFADF